MLRVAKVIIGIFVATFFVACVTLWILKNQLFEINMRKLDAWVTSDGAPKNVQAQIVDPCGVLIFTQADWFERLQLLTVYRDEFDFRVDVCVKMTVNRKYPQPEFKRPELVSAICDSKNPHYAPLVQLCKRSGLK